MALRNHFDNCFFYYQIIHKRFEFTSKCLGTGWTDWQSQTNVETGLQVELLMTGLQLKLTGLQSGQFLGTGSLVVFFNFDMVIETYMKLCLTGWDFFFKNIPKNERNGQCSNLLMWSVMKFALFLHKSNI